MISLEAPAKLSLVLDVLGKRPDGFHDLRMIACELDLKDELVFSSAPKTTVDCSDPLVPKDEENLCFAAVEALKKATRYDANIAIKIEKRIPVAAGLGGGSADAAATLKALNYFWKLGLPLKRLSEIGAFVGSDVPVCLQEGTKLVEGRGDVVTSLPALPALDLVLVVPEVSLEKKTQVLYSLLDSLPDKERLHPPLDAALGAIEAGDKQALVKSLGNSFECVKAPGYEATVQAREQLKAQGALNACMAGAGPTVYGVFEDKAEAKRAASALKKSFANVLVCKTL